MTRDEHDAATLAIITASIGKILPCQRDMAAALNSSGSRINHSIARLQAAGIIKVEGLGNCRSVEVVGVGSTLARYTSKELATYRAAEAEPVRIESYPCPRCGARSGCGHTAVALSTGRPGGWHLAAGRR
jgi:hypothetical protein